MRKQLAVVVGALAFVYLFVPEPSDVVPIIGGLDEGAAGALLLWALRTLGVDPLGVLRGVRGAPAEPAAIRDVTPRRAD